MRKTFPNSKKFRNANFNTNTAFRNYTSQPLHFLVFNQERNQKHQLQQNMQPKSTNSSPKSFNANRSSQTNRNLWLNFAHSHQFCLTIRKNIKIKLPLILQQLQCPSMQKYQNLLTHRHKATQNKTNFVTQTLGQAI